MTYLEFAVRHDDSCLPWCGPAALAAITGTTTKEARKWIKSVSLRRYLKAVTYTEMADALMAHGYRIKQSFFPRDASECPTLREWNIARDSGGRYLVCITGHWIAVHGPSWVCSMNQKPRHMFDCPYMKAKVRHAIQIEDEQ